MYFAQVCLDRDDLFEELFRVQLSHLFIIFPYSIWIAIVGKVINVIATFCWNYMDLFVMMISAGLSTRFKQINEDLQRIKGKVKPSGTKTKLSKPRSKNCESNVFQNMSEDYWELRRIQYRKLSALCATVDKAISQITLLCFSNNLLFISVQLLHSIR